MEANREHETMELFDQKLARIFQEKLPEMPPLPEDGGKDEEIQELDRESLDQLEAAGETLSADIIRFLKTRR